LKKGGVEGGLLRSFPGQNLRGGGSDHENAAWYGAERAGSWGKHGRKSRVQEKRTRGELGHHCGVETKKKRSRRGKRERDRSLWPKGVGEKGEGERMLLPERRIKKNTGRPSLTRRGRGRAPTKRLHPCRWKGPSSPGVEKKAGRAKKKRSRTRETSSTKCSQGHHRF